MGFEIHTASEAELEDLVAMRVMFVLEMHPDPDSDSVEKMRRAVHDYFARHIASKRFIGYIGSDNGQIACSAGILLYDLPPLKGDGIRTQGHLLNFFTIPGQRNKGFGAKLIEYILADGKKRGIDRIVLNATKMGEPLYRKAGFQLSEDVFLIKELK
jgi:GNAT superfamily N-acetyltransferase